MMSATPTEVEVRVAPDGTLRPLRFSWRGRMLRVVGVGRSWSDGEGDHWLVMTAPLERVFELRRTPEGTWHVRSIGATPPVA